MKTLKAFIASILLTVAAMGLAPIAHAGMFLGNYQLEIQGRYDFHTWVWAITACSPDCVVVTGVPQPTARGLNYQERAQLANGRYTLTVDDPWGLRCGNVYYGPTSPTHDVYSWDATSLVGSLDSTFDANCDGGPGGTYDYPFTLVRM